MEDSGISQRTGKKPGEQQMTDDPPLLPDSVGPTASEVKTFVTALE